MPSTAMEWLEENPEDAEALDELLQATGVPLRVLREYPDWMKRAIGRRLQETFEQDYWAGISEATAGDAERVLMQGLEEGWSIRRMADELMQSLGGDRYARTRARNIARTESGNALNGARKEGMEALQEELGPEVPVRAVWLSVLGTTTRDTHAALDGVPADEDGMWELSGYRVPWPGHVSLPPEERCNCMCTIYQEFGMTAEEAQALIDEYWQRVEEMEQEEEEKAIGQDVLVKTEEETEGRWITTDQGNRLFLSDDGSLRTRPGGPVVAGRGRSESRAEVERIPTAFMESDELVDYVEKLARKKSAAIERMEGRAEKLKKQRDELQRRIGEMELDGAEAIEQDEGCRKADQVMVRSCEVYGEALQRGASDSELKELAKAIVKAGDDSARERNRVMERLYGQEWVEAKQREKAVIRKLADLRRDISRRSAALNDEVYEALKVAEGNRADISVDVSGISSAEEAGVRKGVQALAAVLDNRGVPRSVVAFVTTDGNRAHYSRGMVALPEGGGGAGLAVVVHELGHWVEDRNGKVHQQAVDLLKRRTEGAKPIPLGKGYEPHEVYLPRTDGGQWFDNYTGKLYGKYKSTEILSMGFQWYVTRPADLLRQDPELFRFVAAVARGEVR